MTDATRHVLHTGLEQLDLVSYEQVLWQYFLLLKRWNQAYNLVARADDKILMARHVLDSLSVRHTIKGKQCLDVGSGAGLPGLVLAATMPDTEWVLLDANGKKIRFCEQAIMELSLKNVRATQERIEAYQPANCYDTIISRAYDQADIFIEQVKHLRCDRGQIVAMKGRIDKEENNRAASLGLSLNIEALKVPGLSGQRHAMIFT